MKSSLSLSYLDYLERNKSRPSFNFNDPPALGAFVPPNSPKIEFGDIGWANRNWEIFVTQYNTNLRYKATYNYMQRYFWSILVNIITYFVDFGYQPSIVRLKESGIFNELFIEKFMAQRNAKALDARGIQISQLFHNKGEQIFTYFKSCVEDLVRESRRAVEIEGDLEAANPRLELFEQFARDTLDAINFVKYPGINFANVESIIDNFNENKDEVYHLVKQFFEAFKTMWASSEVSSGSIKQFTDMFEDLRTDADDSIDKFLGKLYLKVRDLDAEYRKLKNENEIFRSVNQEFSTILNEIAKKIGLSEMVELLGSDVKHSREQYINTIEALKKQSTDFMADQKEVYDKLSNIAYGDMVERSEPKTIAEMGPAIGNTIKVISGELKRRQDEIDKKQKEIENLQAQVRKFETKESKAAKAKQEKKAQQDAQLSELKALKEELEKQVEELQQKLDENKKKLDTAQSSIKSNDTKMQEIQRELKKYKANYEGKVQDLKQKIAELQRAQEDLVIANKQIDQLKSTNTEQKSTKDNLLEKVRGLNLTITELESSITGLNAEISRLNDTIKALEEDKVSLNSNVSTLNAEMAKKQKEIDNLKRANVELETAIQEYKVRIAKCTSDIEVLERHNTELQIENDSMRLNNAKLASNLAEAQGQTTTLRNENAQLTSNLAEAQGQNTTLRNENAQLQGQTSTLQSEKAQLTSNLAQARGQVEALQSENMEEKSANERLQSELNRAKDYSAEVKAELDKMVQSLNMNRLRRTRKQPDEDMQEVHKGAIIEENTFEEDEAADLIPISKRQRKPFYDKIYDIISLLGDLFNLPPFDVKGDPLFDEGSYAQDVRRLFYETFKGIIAELRENVINKKDITDEYIGNIFNRYWNAGIKLDRDRDNVKWSEAHREWTGNEQITWLCYRTYVAYAMFSIIKVGQFKPNYISTAMFKRIFMIYDELVSSQGMINISTMSNIMFILYLYLSWNKNVLRLNDISIVVKYYNPKTKGKALEDIKPFGYFMGDLLAFQKYDNIDDEARINEDKSFDDPNIRIMRELNFGSLHNGTIQEDRLPDIKLANADPLFLNIISYINDIAQRTVARLDQHDFTIVGAGTIRLNKSRDIVNSLKRSIIKPIIGVNMGEIAIYPVRGLHKDSSMEELTNSVYICMNKRTGNYRVILLNKQGEYAISYPGNSFTNPLMPYDLYLNPQKRNEVIIVDSTDAVPSYFIRLDTRYKDNKVIDNDDLLNSLFPKVEMRNISLRELLEYIIPSQHVIVNGVGSGVITSRDIVNTFITPVD